MSSGTNALDESVTLRALAIDGRRLKQFKRMAGPATNRSAAIPYIDDSGNQLNFKCPKCGATVGIEDCAVGCDWNPTDKEWRDLRSRDPEDIPAQCYNEKVRTSPFCVPRFDKNLKPFSGKDRRMKRLLSKCSY